MSQIIRDITEITRCGVQYRTDKLSPFGLKACHASYLSEICAHPGISQDKLARLICLNKSNVTRHLSQLEKNGYVERRPSETDKRETLVYPTQKMCDVFPEVRRITDEWNRMLSADISEEELEVFHRVLDKMIERSIRMVYPKGGCNL